MNYQNSLPLSTLPIFRARNTALVGQKRERKGKGKKENNKQRKKREAKRKREEEKRFAHIYFAHYDDDLAGCPFVRKINKQAALHNASLNKNARSKSLG